MKKQRLQKQMSIKELSSRKSFFSVFSAFLIVFVQIVFPVAPAFADEVVVASGTTSEEVSEPREEQVSPIPESVETIPEPEPEIVSSDTSDPENVVSEIVTDIPETSNDETTDTSVDQSVITDEADEISVDTEGVLTDAGNNGAVDALDAEPNEVTDNATTSEGEISNEDILPDIVTDVIEEDVLNEDVIDVPEEELVEDSEPEEEVSTSTVQTVVVPELHTAVNDGNSLNFGIDDCAQVSDGSFYCRQKDEPVAVAESDRVFTGPDADGDSEIYIEHDGEIVQVTRNLVDDAAPYYDEPSNSIVWHRLVDARYQIVSYDLETGNETVLTNDHYNNMQPSRSGNLTVWQGWVGNDWEILLMDKDEISMLTDNMVHDIGPRINGDYVIWQAEEMDGWKVRVYNRVTKVTETISGVDGASVENPRFVLLYDAKQQNGDVETRGYDLDSGETVPLSAVPYKTPDDIPEPDQTGEDRALIVSVTQLKTKTEDDADGDTSVSEVPENDTGTSTEDVVVPPFESSEDITTTVSDEVDSTIQDLVIDELPLPTSQNPIEDLIIPPFSAENTESTDPQGVVATST